MSAEKHIHGLIEVTDQRFIRYSDGERHVIARCTRPNADNMSETSDVARRFVACWNACDGVETELIEAAGDGLLAKSLKQVGQKHDSLRSTEAQRDELLSACKSQHRAIDALMARLIELDPTFMPSQSAAWPAVVQGNAAIAKVKGSAT